jgi:hypothetical protein
MIDGDEPRGMVIMQMLFYCLLILFGPSLAAFAWFIWHANSNGVSGEHYPWAGK